MKRYEPTPEQIAALLEAGFTLGNLAGGSPLVIKDAHPKRHRNVAPSARIPSVAIVWLDGTFNIRRAPQRPGDCYSRKVYQEVNQERAFNRAMAYVLLGMYDDEVI